MDCLCSTSCVVLCILVAYLGLAWFLSHSAENPFESERSSGSACMPVYFKSVHVTLKSCHSLKTINMNPG